MVIRTKRCFTVKIDIMFNVLKVTMESIVTFSFPELNCRYSLNRRGPRKYGTLDQLLQSGPGVPSTVRMPDGTDVLRQDIRYSTKFTSVVSINTGGITIDEQLNKLDENIYWSPTTRYSVIEYLPGGFFSEHRDTKQKRNHCATLLIFPPAVASLEHTGGELIIDKGRFRFDSSANRAWTFIAFHTELPHECKPVLSGRRVVLKTELYSLRPVNRIVPDYNEMICDGSLR
jgi:hypothetical protein